MTKAGSKLRSLGNIAVSQIARKYAKIGVDMWGRYITDNVGEVFAVKYWVIALAMFCLQAPTSFAGELTGTLKRIDETGQINLGYRQAEPPMSFRDQSGNAAGYSIDLCDHIAAAVKLHLNRSDIAINYLPVTAENRFTSIESGTIDILCGATTKTLGRAGRVGFTQLTFVTGASLLSLGSEQINSVQGLKGKRVAVVSNTTTIEALNRTLTNRLIDADVIPVSAANEGMSMLDKGEVQAFSSDQVVLIGQVISRTSDREYYLAEEMFSFEPFALAIARNDADFQVVADRALSRLNRTGQILSVYRKWFRRFAKEPPEALKALYQLNGTPE